MNCADAWRGSNEGGLIAKAMSRTPSAQLSATNTASSESSIAAAAAAKKAARIAQISGLIDRYSAMLSDSVLRLPDGGANVRPCPGVHAWFVPDCVCLVRSQLRSKREELAAELEELRESSQAIEQTQSQASQPSGADVLADSLGALSV